MHTNDREKQILSILSEHDHATVKDLSQMLYISESSIRRDLTSLENKGIIKRTYGRAEIITSFKTVLPFSTRSCDNIAQKRIIAQKAAKLIKSGNIIFLDQSSTCFFLAQEITDIKSLTVMTNNLEIISLLSKFDITLYSSGGIVSKENTSCLVGCNAQRSFKEIYADFVFFSAKSLSDDGVISDCRQEEIFVRNAMLGQADKKIFLCDSSKIGSHSSYIQCNLSEVDILATEANINDKFKDKFPKLEII